MQIEKTIRITQIQDIYDFVAIRKQYEEVREKISLLEKEELTQMQQLKIHKT